MAGILSFDEYIGGADNIKIEETFPSNQKKLVYDFNTDINGWTFEIDHQTLVVDKISYDRNTGEPNFSASKVIGYFPKSEIDEATYVTVNNANTGVVSITIPANTYSGPILPDARQNVPITIVGVTWTTNDSPATINTHRWAFIQCWEPDVETADPALSNNYTAIVLAS